MHAFRQSGALAVAVVATAYLAACSSDRTGWTTYTYKDPMTDAVEWHASVSAGNPDHPRATLVFTCSTGAREFALLTRDRLLSAGAASDTPVRYRRDSAAVETALWRLGTDGHSAVTDAESAAKLLATVRERVIFGWQTDTGEQPITEFSMAGFEAVRDSLRGAPCRLRP